jgi:protein phosphatase PTC7
VSLAVADGVSSWAEDGVDPALLTQAFLYHINKVERKFFEKNDEEQNSEEEDESDPADSQKKTPFQYLDLGHDGVMEDAAVKLGKNLSIDHYNVVIECYLCCRSYHGDCRPPQLVRSPRSCQVRQCITYPDQLMNNHVGSLGDSGFYIIRDSGIAYKQRPQSHRFNMP